MMMMSNYKNNTYLMRNLLYLIALITSNFSFGQYNVCLGNDITVCAGSTVQVQNCGGGTPGNSQGIVLNNPTTITLSDDQWSGAINMGFNFSFYGNTYNQCLIGSNCIISFDMTKAGGYCSWSLSGAGTMPNTSFSDAKNAAMPAYQDILPPASPNGAIQYQTIGTAPNRMFVVLYKDQNFFSCTSVCNYIAAIFYETSNVVEFHIGEKPLCTSWNGGLAIQGTENAAGTVAHITPGRNNTQWSANQEGKRWTPTTPSNTSNYTITTVPYILVTSPNTTFQWENTLGQTFPYNNGVLNVTCNTPGTVGYFLSGSACGASLGGVTDTTWITTVNAQVTASMTPDICSAGLGSVTATPLIGIPPYTFNWPALGAGSQTVNNVYAGVYTVQMTDGNGCSTSANVVVTDTPAQYTSSSTLVSCPGGNDGTATADMVPHIGNVTYLWDDPMAQTTSTAVGLTAGTYNCTITSDVGCSNVVSVNVTEIPGMIGSIANQSDVTCNSGNDGVIEIDVQQGTAPYTYSWDNSSSTSNIANDLYAGTHTCTITDANGCIITVTGTIAEPPALSIDNITPDTQICPEADITLNVNGSGGSSPYTYTWLENGTPIGTGTSITVDPDFTNTQYCAVMSEACGSPEDTSCTLIYFPTPIVPNAKPDEFQKCVPGFYEFDNISSNGAEIQTAVWDFGNPELFRVENGADSTSLLFTNVGTYDLAMTITSIYGCVYSDTMHSIIEVVPTPTADFNISNNPATIFETTVFMQDKSSNDVVNWMWSSPDSYPSSSNLKAPTFTFPEGETGTYPITLVVETEKGCMDTVTYTFNVVEDILFYAPNSFTPDGDEHNQVWKIEVAGIDIYDFDLYIFNRWGQVIWESHDPSVGWDGTYAGEKVQTGTYIWRAQVSRLNNDDKEEFHGTINVLK